MDDVTRRTMLWGAGASVAATGLIQEAAARTAAFGPDDPYDLVIRGGEVLDPSQALRGRRDIGIRNAAIAAVEPEIAAARGTQVLDATGQLVLPGLVDFHAHVLPGGGIGLSGDELVPYTGTTTYVSAGDAGVGSFAAFKHFGIAQSRTRILAFLHISSIGLSGFPVGEMLNIDHARVDAAAKMLAENPDVLLGIKVRETLDVVGNNGLEPLKRAIAAAERSGVEGARVMCHIGNAPGNLSRAARPPAAGRRADPCLQRRRQQHGGERQGSGRRPCRQAARRADRCRPRRRQLRLHRLRGRPAAGFYARHHQQRHPRRQRQHARQAVPAVGDEQVPQSRHAARAGGQAWRRPRRPRRSARCPSSARCSSARRRTCRWSRSSKARWISSTPGKTSARANATSSRCRR